MARIAKKATQDGTFTVYVGEAAFAWASRALPLIC